MLANVTGSRLRNATVAGTSPTRSSSWRCSTTRRGSDTGSVTTALAELTFGDIDREPFRRSLGETQRQRGRDATHFDHQRRHQRPADGPDDAERRVAGLQALQHRDVFAQRLELTAHRAGPVEHSNTKFGRDGAPATPYEQLDAELRFELVDVSRDVRLHRVQPVSRGGERTLLGHRKERFELTKIHADPL